VRCYVRELPAPAGSSRTFQVLQSANVLCFFSLAAGSDVELDVLTLAERLVSVSLDIRIMDEYVIALLTRDEAEALLGIEKLYSSSSQRSLTLRCMASQPL